MPIDPRPETVIKYAPSLVSVFFLPHYLIQSVINNMHMLYSREFISYNELLVVLGLTNRRQLNGDWCTA
jgi:hypothetical protein